MNVETNLVAPACEVEIRVAGLTAAVVAYFQTDAAYQYEVLVGYDGETPLGALASAMRDAATRLVHGKFEGREDGSVPGF